MEPKLVRWTNLEPDRPIPRLERRKLVGVNVILGMITLFPGCVVPRHSLENEQFAYVLSGHARFEVGSLNGDDWKEVDVLSGEVLHLPPNVPHSVVAIEETQILDILSPVSGGMGIDQPGIVAKAQSG